MLGIDGKVLFQPSKFDGRGKKSGKSAVKHSIQKPMLLNFMDFDGRGKKFGKSAVKHSIEKRMLLNFMDLSIIFCPSLSC